MTDTSESTAKTATSGGLSRVLTWVGIIAGSVFVVAVVFFSGFFVSNAGGHWGGHQMSSHSMDCCDHMGADHHMEPGHHM